MITQTITKSNYMSAYKTLYCKICQSEVAEGMIELVKRSVKNDTIVSTKYKSCNDLVEAFYNTFGKKNIKANSYDTLIYSCLIKLGIFLKKDGILYLNPLLAEKSTKRSYELVINFYNLLLEGQDIDVLSLDDLKKLSIAESYEAYIKKENADIHYNNYLVTTKGTGTIQKELEPMDSDLVVEISFNTPSPKKNLTSNEYRIHKMIRDTYRNLCNNYIKRIVAYHMQLLEEQGVLSVDDSRQTPIYTFRKMTTSFLKSLKDYKATDLYLNNVAPDALTASQEYLGEEVVEDLELTDYLNSLEDTAQHPHDFIEEQETMPDNYLEATKTIYDDFVPTPSITSYKETNMILNVTAEQTINRIIEDAIEDEEEDFYTSTITESIISSDGKFEGYRPITVTSSKDYCPLPSNYYDNYYDQQATLSLAEQKQQLFIECNYDRDLYNSKLQLV